MNPWYELFITAVTYLFLFICAVGCLIGLKRYKKKSFTIIILLCDIVLLIGLTLFVVSHKESFKYNDWAIINSNISMVEKKYGSFDLGHIEEGKAGKVAYYVYTDNGPIMPDYLERYYYMEYDEWGVVYDVYVAARPGG